MTKQVLAYQPHTVTVRNPQGGIVVDSPITVEGAAYSDPDCKDRIHKDGKVTDGAGEFTFYGKPGSTVTVGDLEPVQFVGVTERAGGLAAVAPDDTVQVSEEVSDLSLVGASLDGHIDNVRVREAVAVPPGEPEEGTPDGTTATDAAAAPPSTESEPGQAQEDTPPEPEK